MLNVLQRWAEHFNSVLNRQSAINDEAIAPSYMPQAETSHELHIPPKEDEVRKAIKQMPWSGRHDFCGSPARRERQGTTHRPLHYFIDLTKTFDTVRREAFWKMMVTFGCSRMFTSIVRQFHDGMLIKALDDVEKSNSFPLTNGCVLASTLFSMFSAMLTDAFHDCDDGIHIRYRSDGGLFNPRRLRAVTKVKKPSSGTSFSLTTVP
ncbi:hypothetical protein HOLleu_11807 [Holothuria leucospilota]|uniref:Reverse transcriptase domain-containing protein n=1 Tax=Holothuria leucospilota TaxID=206669 RepID=A0A9Q1CAN8_HOLLE|nr:hypothetical protein HOLleu_11807 [Holothuria leucospilota]